MLANMVDSEFVDAQADWSLPEHLCHMIVSVWRVLYAFFFLFFHQD